MWFVRVEVSSINQCPMFFGAGALTNIRNNENQLPYDLSSKNPEVGRLLMVRGKNWVLTSVWLHVLVALADEAEGYGDEGDSD